MTPEQFCYWLQGFAELNEDEPNDEQWEMIKNHLGTVFDKVTPPLKKSGKVLNEDKKSPLEEAIKDMQKNRVNTYCDPYTHPGKIC